MDTATFSTMIGCLSLAEADAADPSALAVLFDPAVGFAGPVHFKTATREGHGYVVGVSFGCLALIVNGRNGTGADGLGFPAFECWLDLHVQSIAAHVAWLCARAIDPRATSGWADQHPEGWVLHWTIPGGSATATLWSFAGNAWASAPNVPDRLTDTPAFLAALFLALAKAGRITTPDRTR